MKHIFLLLLFSYSVVAVRSQTVTPLVSNEYCPNTEYTFTVSITNKTYSSMIGESGCYVTQLPSFPVGSTFTFKGKFADLNQKQTFRIYFTDNTSYGIEFKKVKSLVNGTCTPISPNQLNVTAPTCQIVNIPVSFSNIQWITAFEPLSTACFGSITDYEYQLPANWKIGTNVSNGSNWIQGNNSVTVTTDLSTTGNILVRPRNSCGANLSSGQPSIIYVSRPAPNLSLTTNLSSISCGSSTPVTFTVSGTASSITGYVWNIGATPNGWIYNGNPAPATISTTTNSLSLTPVTSTGTAPSNVSATVNFTGGCQVNYTKTLPFIIPGGTYTILGNDIPCTNMITTYTLQQTPPAGTTVTWDISPNDATITLSPSGTSVDVDATNATKNQNYHLTATISGYCYYATALKQFVIPTASFTGQVYGLSGWSTSYGNALVEGDNYFYLYGSDVFEVWISDNYGQAFSNGWWEYVSGDYATGGNYMYLYFDTYTYSPPDSYYNYHFTDDCGSHSIPFHFISVSAYPPSNYIAQSNNESKYSLNISPNPASSFIQISIQDLTSNTKLNTKPVMKGFDYNTMKRISVYDKLGVLVLQQKAIIPKSGLRLNVSNLKRSDVYNVIIEDTNGNRISGKFIRF